MQSSARIRPASVRVVIAGGGIAALEALVALHALAGEQVEITLVAPTREFRSRAVGVGEAFGRGGVAASHSLAGLTAGLGARLVVDAVVRVSPERQQLALRSGQSIGYDILIVAIGGCPYPAFAHGVSFERPGEAREFDELLRELDEGAAPKIGVVVPDGVAWTLPAYEIALMLRARAAARRRPLDIELITPETMPLAAFGLSVSRVVGGALDRAGVNTRTASSAIVLSDAALMAGGQWLTMSRIVSLPRLAGPRLTGLPGDADGFISVDADGRVRGTPNVFAAGDGTTQPIKHGGLAAQQADRVARSVARLAGAEVAPAPGHPVLQGALATPDGPLYMKADLGPDALELGSVASRVPLWWPPTKVATQWLGPHLQSTNGKLDLVA